MKNLRLKSKLFAENGLNENASKNIVGGISSWTEKDSDSSNKTGYDVMKITKDRNGGNSVTDTFSTGASNTDRPIG